ncbi:MAG TPA: tRNA lysidine(34) synthetase TilS [Candidatus Polarisedimenticolaceae bacterium]
MADRTEIAFRRAALELVPPNAAVVVAVSGGGDSVALLHLLRRLAKPRGLTLVVAHLDHALRRGSTADRRFVEGLAEALGLPCVADRRDVAKMRRRDESPEEAARRVRRGFLLEVAGLSGSEHVALGHTLDDQAETILMRLARGAGPAALAGMAPAGPGPFIRPALGLSRMELRVWLVRHRLAWRDDPSNRSAAYDRNRLRRLVVPALAEALNPEAARHLAQAAERLRVDAAHLDREAAAWLMRLGGRDGDTVVLDARGLAALAPALAGRAARMALEQAGCDPRRISAKHVEALLKLAAAGSGSLDLPSGRKARAGDGRVTLAAK